MKTGLYRTILRGFFGSLLALFSLAFMVLPAAAASPARSADSPDMAKIDAFITAAMRENRIPGVALGIVDDSQIVHLRGFGVADPSGRAVTPQTPFVLGSVSKSFTALAIMQLVEQGKLELDAPVQRYLPWFRFADTSASAHITVRHLLNQTSGIPASAGAPTFLGVATLLVYKQELEAYVRGLSTVTLDRPVGTSFEYANANYAILGLIVEKVSGQSYESYIQQHIFTPLQMSNSFASVQDASKHGLAQDYRWEFGLPVPYDTHYSRALLPAGFLVSSAQDMTHYLIAQMNGGRYGSSSVLSPTDIATLHASAVPTKGLEAGTAYGMGWFNGPTSGVPTLWHNGEAGGFYTYMVIEPQTHWGAILMFNIAGLLASGVYTELQAGIAHLLAGDASAVTTQSMSRFYLITDIIFAIVLVPILWPLVRMKRWYRKLEQNPRRRALRITWPLVRELLLPLLALLRIPALFGASWTLTLMVFPDIGSWLLVVFGLLIVTGTIRTVLVLRVLRRKNIGTPLTVPASSPSLV